MEAIEREINRSIFSGGREKTFADKVLARDDVMALRDIMRKENLQRPDILELMYLLTSTEAKLHNFDEYDRYVVNIFFVWVREFISTEESLFDCQEDMRRNGLFARNPRLEKHFNNGKRLMEHNVKFIVDIYLNLSRTTTSRKGTGFIELLQNRFEIRYPDSPAGTTEQPKKSWWGGGQS